MRKLINAPYAVVDESLAGILYAHPGHLRAVDGSPRAIVRAYDVPKGKVGIVTGGGYGHVPVFLGYVGPGLADGVAVGNVFSSPAAEDMLAALHEVDDGAGVLSLFGNYQGDAMNFEMAAEAAALDGIEVRTSIVSDDVASAGRSEWQLEAALAAAVQAARQGAEATAQ